MGMFNEYPYRNLTDLNLDYIFKIMKEVEKQVEYFVSLNAIKYADPIQWDITRQYEKNTIVIDPLTGTAYISVAPVPAGTALTRTEYWTVVFDLQRFVTKACKNFTSRYEAETTTTATFNTPKDGWLCWADVLYKANVNITAGDSYVPGGNIKAFTMEDFGGHLDDLLTTDKSNVVAAINELFNMAQSILSDLNDLGINLGDVNTLTTFDKSSVVNAINELVAVLYPLEAAVGDLNDLNTTDKSSIVNAINEIQAQVANLMLKQLGYITPQMFGAVGDGVTDDTQAFQDMLAYATNVGINPNPPGWNGGCVAKGIDVFIPQGIYLINDTLNCDAGTGINMGYVNWHGQENHSMLLFDGNGIFLKYANILDNGKVTIENLQLFANTVDDTSKGTAIQFHYSGSNMLIRNNTFGRFNTCIEATGESHNVNVLNNYFYDFSIYGIKTTDISRIWNITGNSFRGFNDGSIAIYGYKLGGSKIQANNIETSAIATPIIIEEGELNSIDTAWLEITDQNKTVNFIELTNSDNIIIDNIHCGGVANSVIKVTGCKDISVRSVNYTHSGGNCNYLIDNDNTSKNIICDELIKYPLQALNVSRYTLRRVYNYDPYINTFEDDRPSAMKIIRESIPTLSWSAIDLTDFINSHEGLYEITIIQSDNGYYDRLSLMILNNHTISYSSTESNGIDTGYETEIDANNLLKFYNKVGTTRSIMVTIHNLSQW